MFRKYFIGFILFILLRNFPSVIAEYEECTYEYDYSNLLHYCRHSVLTKSCRDKVECREWCAGDVINTTVIDSQKGEVKFYIMPSPYNCCHSSFQISLFLYDDEECNDTESFTEICKHSEIDVEEHKCDNCTSDCSGLIEFSTKYIFSGTYYFVIKPRRNFSSKQECISKPFFIKTNYTKQPIGNTEVKLNFDYNGYSEPLIFYIKGVGVSLAEKVIFELSPCIGEEVCQVSVTHRNGESKGECCEYRTKVSNCSCYWDREYLICEFTNMKPNEYCVQIHFKDPRCSKYTLWRNNITSCQWAKAYLVEEKEEVSQGETVHVDKTVSEQTLISAIVLGTIACVIATISVFFLCKKYPRRIYHPYVSCAPSNIQQFSYLHKPKILLLYPRDCENFMNVMQDFRSLLQENLHAQVIDMWDTENWENVNEVGHQWVVQYFLDTNIKIIIIASQCSKLFEYALIHQKNIQYHEPNYFDNIFLYSFKEAVTLANFSNEQYSRFFVVRMDELNCEENKFSVLTPCTVYTIPQHLKDLTLQIHNMDSGEVIVNPEEISKIQKLNLSLDELNKFKLDNPNYLNEMISVVNE